MITVGIVGASGYGGGELVRLLAHHPEVRLTHVVSETYAGETLSRAFPGLSGTNAGQLVCQKFDAVGAAMAADLLFLAQETGAAMRSVGTILELGKRVIDLSADFRLHDAQVFERWYDVKHLAPALLNTETIAYGLPERYAQPIRKAQIIANPGCSPTATILGLAPLLERRLVRQTGIIVDVKTGISGAGRSKDDLMYRFSEANEAVSPYKVGGVHRHIPEMEQELSRAAETSVTLTFTPHIVPMTRGLLATCYAQLADDRTASEDILAAFHDAYRDTPFVVVRDANDFPSTKAVYGSNYCHITAKVDPRTRQVIVMSVIDNLVKGAAGQAIQNMNLMYDFPEKTGLEATGIWP